jgi:CubicO group peptidase (beta-lactamase class C family)
MKTVFKSMALFVAYDRMSQTGAITMISRFYALFMAAVVIAAPLASNPAAQDMEKQIQQISGLMEKYRSERHFSGVVLVAQAGEVLFKEAYGSANIEGQIPNTVDTKFWIASMSKQFAATVAMLLVQEGNLRLDNCINDFLPDYPEPAGREITLHHLLTHTSGIIQGSPLKGVFAENQIRFNTRNELRSCFQDSALLFSPGTDYQYSNYNYNLLVMIMEKAAEKTYSKLLQTLVFDPLRMTSTGVRAIDSVMPPYATGHTYGLLEDPEIAELTHPSMSLGAGDIYTTAGDLYRWDRALFYNELLSDSSKQIMFTPYANGYGYGWQVGSFPAGSGGDSISVIFHDGGVPGYESIIIRIPEDDRLVIILSNSNEPWLHMRLARPKFDIAPAILAILYDYDYRLPRKSAAYTIAAEDTISDNYNIEKGFAEMRSGYGKKYCFDAEEFYCVGLCYSWKKTYHKARAFLKIAVEDLGVDHLPNAWQCHNVYGESLFMLGMIEPGCAQFERSLELNPGNSFAVRALKAAEPYRTTKDH